MTDETGYETEALRNRGGLDCSQAKILLKPFRLQTSPLFDRSIMMATAVVAPA